MQTSYEINQKAGFKGQIADSKHVDADSMTLEVGSAANLEFGDPVKVGTEGDLVQNLSADADVVHGILLHKHNECGELVDKMTVGIARKARVYVQAGEVIKVGAKAFFDRASKKYFTSAAAGRNEVLSGEFKSDAVADGIVQLEVNLSV